ncbi:hypothetical protein [Nocardia sp. NPDC057455]|uniref:hypothetical protein n=1 Tax=Nocardia sp. NPDC057455 TaxID=3346138 RepID=UPI00366C0908
MTTNPSSSEPEIYRTDLIDGPSTQGTVTNHRLTANDIDESYVGKFMGCHDDQRGVNYQAKILKIKRWDSGPRPGLTLWVRHGQVFDRAAYDDKIHVPFDTEIEIIEIEPA